MSFEGKDVEFKRILFKELEKISDSRNDFTRFRKLCTDYELVRNARDERVGYEGKTLLHLAARKGNSEVISFLVDVGLPIDRCVYTILVV